MVAENPLAELTAETIQNDAQAMAQREGLPEAVQVFRRGALAAKFPNVKEPEQAIQLSQMDRELLLYEVDHPWKSSPNMLYFLSALCAGCAVVQGMDQTVINGAQHFYYKEFQIKSKVIEGLTNGAPYAAAALVGCWLNTPLNKHVGRRGTIAFSCFIAFGTAIWQAAASNWTSFLIARFVLGLAVGAKSATTPIYAAECAPKAIRGALTMMWQMWTAFGIMLGFIVSVAFQDLDFLGQDSQWRWMIGITALPPFIVGILVYSLPESPRWYLDKGRFADAFVSMKRLRSNDMIAARDVYLANKFVEAERQNKEGRNLLREFFFVRRNIRAAQSAWFCMFMQQFCGVNVIAYYSTEIFAESGFSIRTALLVSVGVGALNFLGALPAVLSIDKFGRRNLLLVTFPMLSICLMCAAYGFRLPKEGPTAPTRLGLVAASIYLFMLLYSPGMGPVPFTYSAEAFPLHIRALGMASATSITWAFNFIISFSWPKMSEDFTPTGSFLWYAGWNLFGFIFTYFLLPETKNLTLEELDVVFSVRNRDHAKYYAHKLRRFWARWVLRMDVDPLPPLYEISNGNINSSEK